MSTAMHCPHARDTARTLLVGRRVLNTQRVRVVVQITRARYIGTARGASMTGQLRAWVLLGVLGAAAGELSCVQCPLDRYLDSSTPTTLCTSCPLDSSRIGYAASTVEDCKCNAGYTRSTGSTGSGCAQCARGTFKGDVTDNPCTSCNPNSNTPATGATHAHECVCIARYYMLGGACTICTAGTYKGLLRNDECDVCGANTFCPEGSISEQSCTAFSQALPGSDEIADCECNAGYTLNTHSSADYTCEPCETGKYKNTIGPQLCVDCPANKYNEDTGSDAVGDCRDCDTNSASPTGSATVTACKCNIGYSGIPGAECLECEAGKYRADLNSYICTPCAVNTYNVESGMDDSNACIDCGETTSTQRASGQASGASCVCNAGYETTSRPTEPVGPSKCSECIAGKYQPSENQDDCVSCAAGKQSSGEKQISETTCTDCVPGKFSLDGASECTDCAAGKFSTASAATICTECQPGKYQNSGAGRHLACGSCPTNSGHAKLGVTDVLDCKCNAGYRFHTNSLGGDPAVVTALNYEQNGCQLCDAGYYCSDGFNELSPGETEKCDQYKFSTAGQTACTPCGDNSKGPLADTLMSSLERCACIQGSAGTYHTNCHPCPPGKFQDQVAALGTDNVAVPRTCSLCAAGTYSSTRGASACTTCATHSSSVAGSDSETACTCNNGYYRPRLTDIGPNDDDRVFSDACQICSANWFCNDGGFYICHSNSWSPEQSDSSDDCTCNHGWFSNNTAERRCYHCEERYWCGGGTHTQECPANSESPAGSSTSDACVCEGGYKRNCAWFGPTVVANCEVQWAEDCVQCLAG